MVELDSEHADEFKAIIARLASSRTSRCEYGNGENLKTYFMSDGCTNIVTRGNEYADSHAGINSTSGTEVNTTVNQCLLASDGKIQISLNKKQSTLEKGDFKG